MMNYNRFRRLLVTPLVSAAAGLMTLASCTTVDDTLGSNLVPENQQMKAGYVTLPKISDLDPKRYVETRLFQNDSIPSSNLSYGYFGSTLDDTLGLRSAGFMSQYISYYKVEPGYFGYLPLFDSAQLLLSIKGYGQDTITPQKYYVYEVTDNKYISEKEDSIFYLTFDPEKEGIVSRDPLFSFVFPNEEMEAPTKTVAVTLTVEAGGMDYIDRLMLKKDNSLTKAGDYSIYSLDSLKYWMEAFKGLYVRPASDQAVKGKGGFYATSLEASGLSVYGRNRVKDDPSLIKDTIGMVYYFYDSYVDKGIGNVSINTLRRDYSQASPTVGIDPAKAAEWLKQGDTYVKNDRPTNPTVYVEGMAGVITEITFAQEFFDALEAELAEQNEKAGTSFRTMAFSQVRMSIYFSGSTYDWTQIDPTNPGKLIEEMNAAQNRLGLYTNYKKAQPITDYAYSYESDYGGTIAYGGTINRSRGCYVMDITSHAQALWKSYTKERDAAKAAGRDLNLDNIENRTVYLGPEAYSYFSTAFTVAQGMASDAGAATPNKAPIRFELTYNMIK